MKLRHRRTEVAEDQRQSLLEAVADFERYERYCREQGDSQGLERARVGQEMLLRTAKGAGDLDGAMLVLAAQERTCREFGDRERLQVALGNQAVLLAERGDLEGAVARHEEEEQICRELGDMASLQVSLGEQAKTNLLLGRSIRAAAQLKEMERICRENDLTAGLATSLGLQAMAALKADRWEETCRLTGEVYELVTEHHLDQVAAEFGRLFDVVEERLAAQERDGRSGG